ncbi:hypothetical protein TWF788_002281 [Orbilia oligospora]|uniref:BTB domain-containing protein n=1 Tax=Orbilia oligospora TaxID=2813651 RepID=A0A7C8U2T7_ORBOL|nr:hypothetical protein TWF788_002281 [Orbilia oligospora]
MAAYSFSPLADSVVELTDGSNKHLFLVSSEILRIVSPVWRKALDPDSKFAPLEKITVNGTEYPKTTVEGIDHPSFKNVFDILHHQASATPRFISFQNLRSIAILVDQYDFANALAPWPHLWIESLTTNNAQHLESGYEDWLFIATVFRDVLICKDIILAVSKQLVRDLVVAPVHTSSWFSFGNPKIIYIYSRWNKSKGKLVEVNLELVPEKILVFVRKEREDRLSKALLPLWTFTQNMINSSFSSSTATTKAYCKNSDCFALALGSFIKSISSGGLQKVLLAEAFRIPGGLSLDSVITTVQNLRMTTLILERNPTYLKRPSHVENHPTNLHALKTLVADLPEEIFLRNHQDSTIKYTDGRYQTCPLARHLALEQKNALAVVGQVVGFTDLSS